MKKLTAGRSFFYCLWAAGYALFFSVLVVLGIGFFYPSVEQLKEGMLKAFPDSINTLPLYGLAALLALLADLIFHPLLASRSKNLHAASGKRRFMLPAAAIPLALCASLVFFPPLAAPSALNVVAVILLLILFAFFSNLYRLTALSLMTGIVQTDKDRLMMSVIQGFFLLSGALLGVAAGPALVQALGLQAGYQSGALVFSIAGAALLVSAFFAFRQKPGMPAAPETKTVRHSIGDVLAHKPFRSFILADGLVSLACFLIASSAFSASINLMLVDSDFARANVIVLIMASLVCIPLARFLILKIGFQKAGTAAAASLALLALLFALTGIFPNAGGLRWNCVTSVAVAGNGDVYFGTWRGGSRLSRGQWQGITRADGLVDERITSIAATDNGVWFGTLGGVSFFDGREWTNYSRTSGLPDNRVTAVLPRAKAVWFETPAGVSRFDDESWQHYAPPPAREGAPALPVKASALGQRGDLWLGGDDGARRLSETGWTHVTRENGLKDDTVTCIETAPNGDMLFGTYKGVARFNGKTWTYYTKENGLASNAVFGIKKAPDGQLYFLTSAGVTIFDGNSMRTITTADGLAHNRVTDVAFGSDGAIWFASGNGVSEFRNGMWISHQYPLPWIWGMIIFILLGFPLAVLLVVPAFHVTGLAGGEQKSGFVFGLHGMARRVCLIAALLLGFFLFSFFNADIADPLGVRLALLCAVPAAAAGAIAFGRVPGTLSGEKKKQTGK